MKVFILKEGKEYNQGVAYLRDGTMVVVDNARKMISGRSTSSSPACCRRRRADDLRAVSRARGVRPLRRASVNRHVAAGGDHAGRR